MRIPLAEVVRFKEKQWFVEELEGSREGDANAMLRLAKVCVCVGGSWRGRVRGTPMPCSGWPRCGVCGGVAGRGRQRNAQAGQGVSWGSGNQIYQVSSRYGV